MKALVLGYGSIGKRHARVLAEQLGLEVEVVTRVSECAYPHYATLDEAGDLQRFDYFVVATETNRHYQNLLDLNEAVADRTILVEKPLFFRESSFTDVRNRIFVGYNLRFHPALQKARELFQGKKVSAVNVQVGEYLPWWRPGTNYRTCYSAKRSEGGGVVFDISHEIDYIQWLFGEMKNLVSLTERLSDLEIDSDDYSSVVGWTERKIAINLSMDYLSMLPVRSMLASASDASVLLDLERGLLTCCDKNRNKQTWDFSVVERDHTYREMHRAVLERQGGDACTLQQGLAVMRTIQNIYTSNLGGKFHEV
jgi:CMP-N,N'-diacetyllegionaminic acid synthase